MDTEEGNYNGISFIHCNLLHHRNIQTFIFILLSFDRFIFADGTFRKYIKLYEKYDNTIFQTFNKFQSDFGTVSHKFK